MAVPELQTMYQWIDELEQAERASLLQYIQQVMREKARQMSPEEKQAEFDRITDTLNAAADAAGFTEEDLYKQIKENRPAFIKEYYGKSFKRD